MATTREHGATAATTVLTSTLTAGHGRVRIVNRGGSDLFVAQPHILAASITAPTVNGADLWVVPVNQDLVLNVEQATGSPWEQGAGGTKPTQACVKMISTAITQYTVEGLGF